MTLTANNLARPATETPNLLAKDLLAKLMATEDITVEHDPKAQTAAFNMDTRVLTLPVWKDLDADTLDMLIGHEVSHALNTPAGAEPLMNACKAIDAKNPMVAKDYLNVVEDARIERMIKDRFPGLKRAFAVGYRELLKRDLFGLKKVGDLKTLPLIDRINLQYKIGWLVDVPFSAKELPLAQRVRDTVTWDDVVALSKEIYDFAKESRRDNPRPDPQRGGDPNEGEEGADPKPQDGEKGDDADGENGPEPQRTRGTDDEGAEEKADAADGGDDADGEDADENGEDADANGEDADENGDDADGDATDGKRTDKTADDSDADAETEGGDGQTADNEKGDGNDNDDAAPVSQTARNAEDAMRGLVDGNAASVYYADLPEIDNGFVMPLSETLADLNAWAKTVEVRETATKAIYESWRENNANAVQILATEFDRRKAADAHKRTMVAETGALDPNRLHAYRIAEDIFLSNTYVKDGKNHGLVLLLDMSGSMANVFHDTVIQLVTLAHFCRRVNIPFTFYGYTDRGRTDKTPPSFKAGTFGADRIRTRLVTLLQDGMSQNVFADACGKLLLSSYDAGSGLPATHPTRKTLEKIRYTKGWGAVEFMRLDGTPTNAALMGLPAILAEFKRVKRIQVMNLIVLTDGEASDDLTTINYGAEDFERRYPSSNRYSGNVKIVWRDKVRRKEYGVTYSANSWNNQKCQYTISSEKQSALLLAILRDRLGIKSVCIHLANLRSGKSITNSIAFEILEQAKANGKPLKGQDWRDAQANANNASDKFSENDWISLPNGRGFDEYIVIRVDVATDVDPNSVNNVNPNDKNALRDLRKAFAKSMMATRANRPLMTRVAELISK